MNTLKLKAVNVKEARFWNSTFAHIPVGGFEVSRAKMLNIKVIRHLNFYLFAPVLTKIEKRFTTNVATEASLVTHFHKSLSQIEIRQEKCYKYLALQLIYPLK